MSTWVHLDPLIDRIASIDTESHFTHAGWRYAYLPSQIEARVSESFDMLPRPQASSLSPELSA
jgi:hypothetical protein